ncbi:hypothetical protein HPB49_010420 [Dermacentor silvarum]|uniref:Uncharacterized protein n=1 Tax=Dermacentor silvarum TaxID=543639 RepID=A0ACB8DCK3_DERSI|nr:hypothetical protein HPB49_010420 [Dermacentor silvarum]
MRLARVRELLQGRHLRTLLPDFTYHPAIQVKKHSKTIRNDRPLPPLERDDVVHGPSSFERRTRRQYGEIDAIFSQQRKTLVQRRRASFLNDVIRSRSHRRSNRTKPATLGTYEVPVTAKITPAASYRQGRRQKLLAYVTGPAAVAFTERVMPSDAKKKRDAKKKEAVKSRNQQQQKKTAKNAANGDTAANILENGDCQGDSLQNGDNMSEAERELVRRLEEDMRLNAAARACTGVLAVHPRSRDVKIDNLSITFHGVEILVDTRLELNCGQRYGLIGLNGSDCRELKEGGR